MANNKSMYYGMLWSRYLRHYISIFHLFLFFVVTTEMLQRNVRINIADKHDKHIDSNNFNNSIELDDNANSKYYGIKSCDT